MKWVLLATHPWQCPLTTAEHFATSRDMTLLYSGRAEAGTGNRSFLCIEPAMHATASRWQDMPASEKTTQDLPDWVGYLGYGMGMDDTPLRGNPSFITLPDAWLTRYQRLFCFDHVTQTIQQWGRAHATSAIAIAVSHAPTPLASSPPALSSLASNMTRGSYEAAVDRTIASIHAGDFYQANITRKFYGSFAAAPDHFSLFRRLCEASPAPYSAYIRHGDVAIVSASPECFVSVASDGTITTRPIKGSMRRGADVQEDNALRTALLNSEKNRAENLMIVDLMRHDISQVSDVGSVHVLEQSALYSYASIHHLVSTVQAKKRLGTSALQVVQACFPPGSMTGAPKRAAIDWCATQEGMERGVYSGAVGWFCGENRCDLSVVIRTLILDGDRFEFQVGGGIVAESTAQDEWRETLVKARGIAQALGIHEQALAAL